MITHVRMKHVMDECALENAPPLILLVDDDAVTRKMLRNLFTLSGYRVADAEDGARAVEMFGELSPDLVLLDIMMPVMDGYGACEAIRGLPGGEHVPIIIMTALDDVNSIGRAFDAGATDFIEKPVNWMLLNHRLPYLLRARDAFVSLQRSEATSRLLSGELMALLNSINDSLVLFSTDLKLLWANRSAEHLYGDYVEQLVGQEFISLKGGRGIPSDVFAVRASLGSGEPCYERVSAADGRIWDMKYFPVRGEDGTVRGIIELASDMTEMVSLQAEALRSGQLAALGELAAGVAHEINNPINGIINYAQLLVNWLPSACKERDIAERIIREGDRVAGIVRGLLFFAREGMGARLPCNVADVLTDTLTLTEAQIRKDGITLKVGVPTDLGRVRASHQQLQQVFLNIISNARYALNEKFRGFHSAKILEIRGERVLINGRPYIRIGFNDTGTGIPEAIKDKVMTPFFSTKPTCKGTGLGLSISQNIIRDHDGNLSIESREGEFTLVSIDLPTEETP